MGDDKKAAAVAADSKPVNPMETANSSRNLTTQQSTGTGGMSKLKPGEQNVIIALDGSEQSVQAVNCKS